MPDNPAIYALSFDGRSLFVGGDFQSIGFYIRSNAKLSGSGIGMADGNWDPGANAAVYAFVAERHEPVLRRCFLLSSPVQREIGLPN